MVLFEVGTLVSLTKYIQIEILNMGNHIVGKPAERTVLGEGRFNKVRFGW